MDEQGTSRNRPPFSELVDAAATALSRRRDLVYEIAGLVDQPLDASATDRVRAAQHRAEAADRALTDARTTYGAPPWNSDPGLNDESAPPHVADTDSP